MIIRKLKMHNFGIYAGDNMFTFNNKKPVVLIGGKNGRGKTTFLEAVLLALYGANSFAFTESAYKYYGTYLKEHINISDGKYEAYIELEFDINEQEENNTYSVQRKWAGNTNHIKDNLYVKKNGIYDEFLTQNWAMFIEGILPSGLANFYFFDGEKIAELAESETNDQLRDSIKALLGINVIDILENDLGKIIRKLKNEQSSNSSLEKLEKLRLIREQKEAELASVDADIVFLKERLSEIGRELDVQKEKFNAKGGNIAKESRALFSEKTELMAKRDQFRSLFIDLATDELPLVLVSDRLSRIEKQASSERESKTMQIAFDRLDSIFKEYSDFMVQTDQLADFMNYIKKKNSNLNSDNVYNLSESALAQLKVLCDSQLDSAVRNYVEHRADERKVLKRLNQVDNYLSVDIDEKAIQKIYKKICQLEDERIEIEVKLETALRNRVKANGEFISANTEFSHCVESSLAAMERDDDVERMRNYALLAQKTAAKYKLQLLKNKIKTLADTMTKCYKKILGKQNLINRIDIDSTTLEYHYIASDGKEINKSSLSAGEKQLMVISMLWALVECSGQKLPVIIDTPMARLDKDHRMALINKYFPFASKQTIILSTDSEIDENYYPSIKKYVSNEFRLIYDESTRSSKIVTGYFEEAVQ